MRRRLFHALGLMLITGLLFTLSCADGTDPTLPNDLTSGAQSRSYCYGFWNLYPSDDLTGAEVVPIRMPQFDVTQWADVKVTAAVWDPIVRNWTITVQVSNPTQFAGYGVRAIFTDLGGKEIPQPDGFVWLDLDPVPGDERYPFFAIEKDTENREFPGLHVSTRDMTFHFPEGVDKWIPIAFFIDAYLMEPRPDPMVEDLEMAYYPPPCMHATVTARIGDHQSDLADLDVWVDLSSAGGDAEAPLFDDGEHGDGLADDGIFGAEFTDGNFGEVYTFTVYALDPEGNTGENDIWFSPIGYPPLPPIPFETLFIGQFCLLDDERLEVIEDTPEWETFWAEFSPWDMPPPVIDFSTLNVIAVCLGIRPNGCYEVAVDNLGWSGINCGWSVHYVETVPGALCKCEEVITRPYHIITVNKAAFDIMFESQIFVDECDDPCLEITPIDDGNYGIQSQQTMNVIKDQTAWETWWASTGGFGNPPTVDFDTQMAIGVTMGTMNTSGYFPTVDSVCYDDADQLEITVGFHIPGPGCMVMDVITHPYCAVAVDKSDAMYFWTTYDDIYECK